MTLKREFPNFDVVLDIKDPDFAEAPSDFQRRWMLSRAVSEFGDDVEHLGGQIARFVPGEERSAIEHSWQSSPAQLDETELLIENQQVMQAWEKPLMRSLAQAAAQGHGDVLEVGFGMGISASYLQEAGLRSYTVIECNEGVVGGFERWRQRYPERDIRLIRGLWQDVVDQLGSYDGILFDTYPLSQEEYLRNEVHGTAYTHCGEFFPVAAQVLRPGGVFTYFSCEIDSLSRGHQRLLLEHFDSFQVHVVRGLTPPPGCQYWWSDSMAVVQARRAPEA